MSRFAYIRRPDVAEGSRSPPSAEPRELALRTPTGSEGRLLYAELPSGKTRRRSSARRWLLKLATESDTSLQDATRTGREENFEYRQGIGESEVDGRNGT